jgi:hypothetical protein
MANSYTIDTTTPLPPITVGAGTPTSGSYVISTGGTGVPWATTSPNVNVGSWSSIGTIGTNPGLSVSGDAEFKGNIKWKGRDLGKLLEKIEDRLAILTDPDPKKLEKHAALKKAYDHYKLLEKLIGED